MFGCCDGTISQHTAGVYVYVNIETKGCLNDTVKLMFQAALYVIDQQ